MTATQPHLTVGTTFITAQDEVPGSIISIHGLVVGVDIGGKIHKVAHEAFSIGGRYDDLYLDLDA